MTTRWEVERAVMASDLPPLARLVMHTLLSKVDVRTAVIPAEHTPSLTDLEREAGLSRSTVRDHLNRLESDGWVSRTRPPIELARSKRARTQYALSVPSRSSPALDKMDSRAGGAPEVGRQPPMTRAPVALSSYQRPEATSSGAATPAEKTVMTATGCTHAEAAAVVALIEAERQPRKIAPFVKRLGTDGELPEWLARVRNGYDRERLAADVADARQGPECEHLVPGGNDPNHPQCALCRAKRKSTKENR